MNHRELVARLKLNYLVLSDLYRNAKFEEEVKTTAQPRGEAGFYEVVPKSVSPALEIPPDDHIKKIPAKRRNPRDLEWAARNLDDFAKALYAVHLDPDRTENLPETLLPKVKRELALLHLQAMTLCYETEDYFLSVNWKKSKDFIGQSKAIVGNFDKFYAARYGTLDFTPDQEAEAIKNLLIVALLGANECYRRQKYDDGLNVTRKVESLIAGKYAAFVQDPASGLGLRGLCHYIAGKIENYTGEFARAEDHFRRSVEAYSESIWRKERIYERRRAQTIQEIEQLAATGAAGEKSLAEKTLELQKLNYDFELSHRTTLRRCGLAHSFGHGFQSLVLGNVKEAIRSTSIARAAVYRNSGEIYSAYVNLIYYSAKRAESSSDYQILKTLRRNLSYCHRVFKELIPAAHYQNRAIFQIALVYHYMAKWWQKEKSNSAQWAAQQTEAEKNAFQSNCARRTTKYWCVAEILLEKSIKELEKTANTRLLTESLAILAHIQANLGLHEFETTTKTLKNSAQESSAADLLPFKLQDESFPSDVVGGFHLRKAVANAQNAWDKSKNIVPIKCEAGLAIAACEQARARFLLLQKNPVERKNGYLWAGASPAGDAVAEAVEKAKRILVQVLIKNREKGNNARIEATAYLRLAELSLLYDSSWHLARLYYEEFQVIESQTEHDFLRQWSAEIKERLKKSTNNDLVIPIKPGPELTKEDLEKQLYRHLSILALNRVALAIEKDLIEGRDPNNHKLIPRLKKALIDHGVPDGSSSEWITSHQMIEELRKICPLAHDIQSEGKKTRANNKTKS